MTSSTYGNYYNDCNFIKNANAIIFTVTRVPEHRWGRITYWNQGQAKEGKATIRLILIEPKYRMLIWVPSFRTDVHLGSIAKSKTRLNKKEIIAFKITCLIECFTLK